MNTDFNIIVNKINAFRKKYLLQKVLKGFMIFLLLLFIIFLLLNFIEYKIFMSSEWRKILLMTTILFLTIVTFIYILFPMLQLGNIIKGLSRKKVTAIIQKSIPEIQDKLLNVLELNDLNDSNYSIEIINAAITQKIKELKIIDFSGYLKLRNIRNLIFYLIISFLVILTIFLADKSLIVEPSKRIIHYNNQFSRPSHFRYEILNERLEVKKGENFVIKVECKGKDTPSMLYVNIGGSIYLMKNKRGEYFEYELNSLLNDIIIYFTDLKYSSDKYLVKVIPVAYVNNFSIEIVPPPHTGIRNYNEKNIGDIKVAEGSEVKWIFECFDTDSLRIVLKSGKVLLAEKDRYGRFLVHNYFRKADNYNIDIKNSQSNYKTSMSFKVDIIEDLYPEIKVVQLQDSIVFTKFYFKGTIHDDYGFTKLNFHINFENNDSEFDLNFIPNLKPQDFYFTFDMKDVAIPGKMISYYFSVTDNDGINGPKSTTSESKVFQFPEKLQIDKENNENFRKMEEMLNESKKLARELKSDIKELKLKNIDKNISEWERTEMIKEIIDKKENIEKILNDLERINKKNLSFENSFSQKSEDILKKQEEIKKLLEDVLTDELKKLMEEFSKLAKDFNSQKLNDMAKEMDISFENLEKQLNRNLELLKRMKIENDFEKLIGEVKSVRENVVLRDEDLVKTEEFEKNITIISENIQEIERIHKKLNELVDLNEELEEPLILDNFNEKFNEIEKSMKKTMLELEKRKRKNSSKAMEETTDKLDNLIFSMEQLLKSNRIEQNRENIKNLEQILKNILYLSFEQEKILIKIFESYNQDPEIREIVRKQKEIIDQSHIIKDSLNTLSKRAPQVGNIVNNELMNMELNMTRSYELMEEGLFQQLTTNQQIAITSMNNLTLILSDILKKIEEEQQNMEQGNGNCEKPGGDGKSLKRLKSKSEGLKQQLEKMIEELKSSGKNMSKQLGESLMEHEIMQKMLREFMENGMIAPNTRNQLQQIDNLLEQNKKDIINKRVKTSLINRQNEIMSKLLEAEKSEMERDIENKRESNTADDKFYSNPAKMFKNEKRENISIENLEINEFRLNNFYQSKYKNYIEKFNETLQE